ncbi:MAG: DUF3267 domain-containing protein [Clostridia bacterium]|nr:DUF3267 domain-containing protein [Clostridia bacterium]
MRQVTQTLPEGYAPLMRIDLQKDRRTAVRINTAAIAVMAAMALLFHFLAVPFSLFFGGSERVSDVLLHAAALILGYTAYIALHELTHAAVMKAFGAKEVRFGFTGLYAWAGSGKDWFRKGAYLAVALAPVIVWGIVFEVLRMTLPRDWAWIIWALQIGNVSGAAGDLYVTFRFARLPSGILIRDTGAAMDVYAPAGAE